MSNDLLYKEIQRLVKKYESANIPAQIHTLKQIENYLTKQLETPEANFNQNIRSLLKENFLSEIKKSNPNADDKKVNAFFDYAAGLVTTRFADGGVNKVIANFSIGDQKEDLQENLKRVTFNLFQLEVQYEQFQKLTSKELSGYSFDKLIQHKNELKSILHRSNQVLKKDCTRKDNHFDYLRWYAQASYMKHFQKELKEIFVAHSKDLNSKLNEVCKLDASDFTSAVCNENVLQHSNMHHFWVLQPQKFTDQNEKTYSNFPEFMKDKRNSFKEIADKVRLNDLEDIPGVQKLYAISTSTEVRFSSGRGRYFDDIPAFEQKNLPGKFKIWTSNPNDNRSIITLFGYQYSAANEKVQFNKNQIAEVSNADSFLLSTFDKGQDVLLAVETKVGWKYLIASSVESEGSLEFKKVPLFIFNRFNDGQVYSSIKLSNILVEELWGNKYIISYPVGVGGSGPAMDRQGEFRVEARIHAIGDDPRLIFDSERLLKRDHPTVFALKRATSSKTYETVAVFAYQGQYSKIPLPSGN